MLKPYLIIISYDMMHPSEKGLGTLARTELSLIEKITCFMCHLLTVWHFRSSILGSLFACWVILHAFLSSTDHLKGMATLIITMFYMKNLNKP